MAVSTGRLALLDSAEELIARRGIHGTSAREVIKAAGQRNNSAITYHFGSWHGLLDEIWSRHAPRINTERAALLDAAGLDGPPGSRTTRVRVRASDRDEACAGRAQLLGALQRTVAHHRAARVPHGARAGGPSGPTTIPPTSRWARCRRCWTESPTGSTFLSATRDGGWA